MTKTYSYKPWIIIVGVIFAAMCIYICVYLYNTTQRLIPLSVLALIVGCGFEGKRITSSWQTFGLIVSGAFALSFLSLLPGKNENTYDINKHIELWPYFFLFLFSLGLIIINKEKVTAKLTEGITLMQSIAIIYWVCDYGFADTRNGFMIGLLSIGLLFSLFSILHAFTPIHLSRGSRLTLSIWSSIIMLLFAIDNIISVYTNDYIEDTVEMSGKLYIALQYFLLGVSTVYIVQNGLLLFGFFPGKGSFFNRKYFQELRELKDEHIARYSDEQVYILHSLFCILLVGGMFYLNYSYQWLPTNLMIWSVFVAFPFVLMGYDFVVGRGQR